MKVFKRKELSILEQVNSRVDGGNSLRNNFQDQFLETIIEEFQNENEFEDNNPVQDQQFLQNQIGNKQQKKRKQLAMSKDEVNKYNEFISKSKNYFEKVDQFPLEYVEVPPNYESPKKKHKVKQYKKIKVRRPQDLAKDPKKLLDFGQSDNNVSLNSPEKQRSSQFPDNTKNYNSQSINHNNDNDNSGDNSGEEYNNNSYVRSQHSSGNHSTSKQKDIEMQNPQDQAGKNLGGSEQSKWKQALAQRRSTLTWIRTPAQTNQQAQYKNLGSLQQQQGHNNIESIKLRPSMVQIQKTLDFTPNIKQVTSYQKERPTPTTKRMVQNQQPEYQQQVDTIFGSQINSMAPMDQLTPLRQVQLNKQQEQDLMTEKIQQQTSLQQQQIQDIIELNTFSVDKKSQIESNLGVPLQQLLKMCGQDVVKELENLPTLDQCLQQQLLENKKVLKIGEGSTADIFQSDDVILKIVPFEGQQIYNGYAQPTIDNIQIEILAELAIESISRKQVDVQEQWYTEDFVRCHSISVASMPFPARLTQAYRDYDLSHETLNDDMSQLEASQKFIVIALDHAGQDLENYQFDTFEQILSCLCQVIYGMACAEQALEFEHRDLHASNVMVSATETVDTTCIIGGKEHRIKSNGVKALIIDYTHSRYKATSLVVDNIEDIVYDDLNQQPEIFEGPVKDLQARTYQMMKKITKSDWKSYQPKTNSLWIGYLIDFLLNQQQAKKTKQVKLDKEEQQLLKSFKRRCNAASSCNDLISDELFQQIVCQ